MKIHMFYHIIEIIKIQLVHILYLLWHTVFSSKASPTIWSCYANLNHYSFLLKLITFEIDSRISLRMTKCRVGFAIDIVLMMMTVFNQEHPT